MKSMPVIPRGFTLLEVLLALVIFAMISISAYSVLRNVMVSNEVTQKKMVRLTEMQKAMQQMTRDFYQIIDRPWREEGGSSKTMIDTNATQWHSDDDALVVVRGGWLNPDGRLRRSELQKIGYRLVDGSLERLSWSYLDNVAGTAPQVTRLLSGVEHLKLRFYKDGVWRSDWQSNTELPQALEVTLTLSDYGQLQRHFLLPSFSAEVTQ